ncbi:MAG: hypothetical protein AUG89_02350 [Acidobacteria bacterium 13_1_20CM_4_56_7]|nr:MAG: hypothetical protein AUG89_02350 [Acidobacteria bacterium 13_1_20CM_4_56_7]
MKITKWILAVSMLVSLTTFADVSVSPPADGQTVNSPVHVVASASAANGVAAIRVYVDDNSIYLAYGDNIDTNIDLGGGSHHVVVQSWDNTGNVSKQEMTINVAGFVGAGAPSGAAGVTVSSPTNGGGSGSPIHVVASSQAPAGIVATLVYLDDQNVFQTNASNVDTYINAGPGSHNVVVQSWDANGAVYKQPVSVAVDGGAAPAPAAPQEQAQQGPYGNGYYDIDQLGGWDSCNACAGDGGSGPQVGYSLSQWRNSPSIDGQSAQFWLAGGYPYSGALWWKQVTPQPGASHFVYDLYFYYDNPGAPQALEFDVNQVVNGSRYIFGTECNIRQYGTWQVWDTAGHHWVNTGIGCDAAAYNWNHMTWEFQRNGDGSYTFLAVTLNGQKHYVNHTYWPIPNGGNELNVAFQLDSNYAGTEYSVWVDKIGLTYY